MLIGVALVLVSGCGGGGGGTPTGPAPPPGGGNHNPTANLNIDKSHLRYGEIAQLSVLASDQDGDQLTFSWSATRGTVTSSGTTATTATFTAGSQWGQATATVTASDGHGGSAQATAQTYIRNPSAPAFTLRPVASSLPSCTGFALEITSPEAVVLTNMFVWPNGPNSGCGAYNENFMPPLALQAGQTYVFRTGRDCIWPDDCNGARVDYYEIVINGSRQEPDGGTFYFDCKRWRPSSPTSCQ